MADNFFGVTNVGRMRDNNEDAFLAETLPNGWLVAGVIDGVGGYEGGEVAAAIAQETVSAKLQQLTADPVQLLKDALLQANLTIYQEKMQQKGKDQMACVMSVALVDIDNNQFYYAHVGDTRLYLLRDQSLVKVTKDHSFVGFLEDSGRLTEKEAMAHPKRNEINKALGFDPQIDVKTDYIETGSSPFLPGDMLLLCSDGLSDLVNRGEMTSVLLSGKSLQQKGEALVDAANVAGGKDNITVVLVHNNKKPLKLSATKPVAPKKNGNNEAPAAVSPVEGAGTAPAPKKKSSALTWVLFILCLLLLAASIWLWRQLQQTTTVPGEESTVYIPNGAEKQFADSLGLSQRTYTYAAGSSAVPLLLGDTVFVRQDTLHINGNGVVLQADSSFQGPAFLATINNKSLVLENIVFKDFSTAIVLQGKGVQLRNVRFQNCAIPVQHYLFLPEDSTLNGTIRDTFLKTRHSLPPTTGY